MVLDAEVVGKVDGILNGVVGAVLRGHQYAVDVLGTEGFGGKGANQGGVDATRETEDGPLLSVFVEIFADAHNESFVHQFDRLGFLVVVGGEQLDVDALAVGLEIGELAQEVACGVDDHGAAGIEVAAFAADAVAEDHGAVKPLNNLVHAIAGAVGFLVVEDVATAADDERAARCGSW